VTDRESNPRPAGASSGDSTTRLKRSAVVSGTGIHRLSYTGIYVWSAARRTRPVLLTTPWQETDRGVRQPGSPQMGS